MRYLGAYITSSLTRGATTAERIKKAYKSFHHLCGFLKKHPLNWDTVKKLYHALITPVITYSMEVATILKRNRNSLRKMETEMILTLRSLSADTENGEANENRPQGEENEDSNDEDTEHQQEENSQRPEESPIEEDDYSVPKLLDGRTINNKIRVARLNYYGHILRSENEGILKIALEHHIPLPKKRGRPAYTWRTCIRQDIERSGINVEVWQEASMDKQQLKEMAQELFSHLQESEYELSESESDRDSVGSSLVPSEFNGFSDIEDVFIGHED